jgi:K+-sensing histidine kinase KdpD
MKKESSLWAWWVLAIAVVLILGVLDWFTGYELNFFAFYFLPVSVAAWFFGFIGSVALAILSATVWFGADILTGHTFSSSAHAVWNTMIRLVSFLAIGWSVARVRHLLTRERKTAEALSRSLSEIKVLETFLPICAQCKRIRNQQGVWQQLEVYIGQHSNTQFSHGYCPECAKKAMAEAGLIDEKTEQSRGVVR